MPPKEGEELTIISQIFAPFRVDKLIFERFPMNQEMSVTLLLDFEFFYCLFQLICQSCQFLGRCCHFL